MPATKSATVTKQFRDFSGGVSRTASRTAIKDTELFACENGQPIGPGEIQILPPRGPTLATIAAGIASMFSRTLKLAGVQAARLLTINADGSLSAIDPFTGGVTSVAPAGTVTAHAQIEMWQDTPLLIGDPTTGLFSWDGVTLLHYPVGFTGDTHSTKILTGLVPSTAGLVKGMAISGTGIPAGATIASVDSPNQVTLSDAATATAAGVTITVGAGAPPGVRSLAVFEGRLWLLIGSRTVRFSGPDSFTAFDAVSGAGTFVVTDSAFAGAITRLFSALELLWLVGPSGVNAISNVQTVGTPGFTLFSNTNIVANVGSVLPASVATFLRTFLFLAPYGVYAIVGATPQKLSESLDGLFAQLHTGGDHQAPAAVFALNKVFVWAVYVHVNDPVRGHRPVLLCFARNAWFVVSQGEDLTWITGLVDPATGEQHLYGTDGHHVFQCFAGTGPGPFELRTKLWDFGAFTQRKQLLRVAAEFHSDDVVDATVTAENEIGAQVVEIEIDPQNTLTFVGSGPITFVGSGPITWVTSGISLARGKVEGFAGNYLGLRIAGTSKPFVFSALAFEIDPLGEWTFGR